jgi:hypothetical protein
MTRWSSKCWVLHPRIIFPIHKQDHCKDPASVVPRYRLYNHPWVTLVRSAIGNTRRGERIKPLATLGSPWKFAQEDLSVLRKYKNSMEIQSNSNIDLARSREIFERMTR